MCWAKPRVPRIPVNEHVSLYLPNSTRVVSGWNYILKSSCITAACSQTWQRVNTSICWHACKNLAISMGFEVIFIPNRWQNPCWLVFSAEQEVLLNLDDKCFLRPLKLDIRSISSLASRVWVNHMRLLKTWLSGRRLLRPCAPSEAKRIKKIGQVFV